MLEQNGLQTWIQYLANVLEQHGHTDANGILQGAKEVGICQLDDLETVCSLAGSDPAVGLAKSWWWWRRWRRRRWAIGGGGGGLLG